MVKLKYTILHNTKNNELANNLQIWTEEFVGVLHNLYDLIHLLLATISDA